MSSITKKGEIISASSPLVGFGGLIDNIIKDLISLPSVEQVVYYITYTWDMSCCIMRSVSMVQSQRQTWWCFSWNEIQVMAYILLDIYGSYETSIFELVYETWGLAYGMVSFKELSMKSMLMKMVSLHGIQCMLIVDSNHGMT